MDLSIVIPTYNLEKYISTTLKSLINQTQKEFEIIIVDDGSTDNTLSIVGKIMEGNRSIKCKIIKKLNGGVSSARNIGIAESYGKYILFLDGDDYVSIDLVENVIRNINEKNSDIICWGFDIISEGKKNIIHYFENYKYITQTISGMEALSNILTYESMWIWTGSAAYKRNLLIKNNLKYTEGCCNGEDQEFTYKALIKSKEITFINKTLSFYVKRNESITTSYNIKKFDVINAFKRIYDYLNSINSKDVKDVLIKISGKNIIDSYIGNYDSCLFSLIRDGNYKKIIKNDLFNEIDNNYNGLNKEIRATIIKTYKQSKTKIPIKIKLFLISPKIYNFTFLSKIRLKDILKKFELMNL